MELDFFQEADDLNAAAFDPLIKAVNSLLRLTVARGLGRFIITDANSLLDLDPALFGGGGASDGLISRHSWQLYDIDGLEFRMAPGWLNTKQPGEMSDTFVATNNATTLVILEGQFDDAGKLLSCTLFTAATALSDPVGAPDVAPPTSSRVLIAIVADAGSIVSVTYGYTTSVDVTPVVIEASCGSNTLSYQWSGAYRDILTELDETEEET